MNDRPASGVYIHWPWCLSKCPYCDFASLPANPASIDQEGYRQALLAELDFALSETDSLPPFGSVFFGGGTPSLIEPASVATLLDRLAASATLAPGLEVTLEANPGTLSPAKLDGLKAAGVTRLSLGVQALDDQALAFLGRGHDRAQALAGIDMISKRFDRFSIDLIYGRPGQSLAGWEAELAEALRLGLSHISLYQLTYEPETPMGRALAQGRFTPLDSDQEAQFYNQTLDQMAAAGLPYYEVSNFAAGPSQRCRHNLDIWQGGAYLGLGPGAHGRIMRDGCVQATENSEDPAQWIKAVRTRDPGYRTVTPLSAQERARECVMLGLRLAEGIKSTDPALARVIDPGAKALLIEEGLLEEGDGALRASRKGRLLLDGIIALLLPE